ncbi:MAG: MBL fold metallo-hydrolase [Synechococcaceae cyanobacterium]|nr:MBL fold metallo-hydrolase [Synechococcaceae cyanobacterium]
MALHATYFGANGWLLEFGPLRVLVDPWLRGPLVFPPGAWMFHAERTAEQDVPGGLDLLLLTQGLPDHCHAPSLELLDRALPVVGSASAAERVRQLGFAHVTALAPGERHDLGDLRITATAGAPVPRVENGYLLEHPEGRLYLEPHGFLPDDLRVPPVDAVISPVVDLGLPLLGPFVRGRQVLPLLLDRLRPATVLASTTGGEVRYGGVLASLIRGSGSLAEAQALTADAACRFVDPVPGRRYVLAEGGGTRIRG